MPEFPFPKKRRAGRLAQMNKRNRLRAAYLPKSELLIVCWKDLEMREQRGW